MLAVQRLRDMTHLEGERTIVLRASADWQRYERDRQIHGGVHDWHTLEGPAVLDDGAGGCVLLYSGGNWQTAGYGVAAATAPWPDRALARGCPRRPGGDSASTGLRGPGHCSVLTDEQGATTSSCTPGTDARRCAVRTGCRCTSRVAAWWSAPRSRSRDAGRTPSVAATDPS